MKIRAFVRRLCEKFRLIHRCKCLVVICDNPRHKQKKV